MLTKITCKNKDSIYINWFLTQLITVPYVDERGNKYQEFNTYGEFWKLCATVTKINYPTNSKIIKVSSEAFKLTDVTKDKIDSFLNKIKFKVKNIKSNSKVTMLKLKFN